MCQHLMAPKVALPELEGCPQQDREELQQCPPLVPTSPSHPLALPLTGGVMLCRPCCPLACPARDTFPTTESHGSRFQRRHWEQTRCLQNISPWSGDPALVGLPQLCLPEMENSCGTSSVCACPHQLLLSIRNRRRLMKVLLLWLS